MNLSRILYLIPCLFAPLAHAGDIVIQAERAEPIKGGAIFFLYDEEGYADEPLQELYTNLDDNGSATMTFEDIEAGQYAVVVVHDKNGDKKMNKNFLGIPKEKGGFSNNAPPKMGPAKWEKAVFDVGEEPVTQIIYLSKEE